MWLFIYCFVQEPAEHRAPAPGEEGRLQPGQQVALHPAARGRQQVARRMRQAPGRCQLRRQHLGECPPRRVASLSPRVKCWSSIRTRTATRLCTTLSARTTRPSSTCCSRRSSTRPSRPARASTRSTMLRSRAIYSMLKIFAFVAHLRACFDCFACFSVLTRLLERHNYLVNSYKSDGFTALHLASLNGHYPIVSHLIDAVRVASRLLTRAKF